MLINCVYVSYINKDLITVVALVHSSCNSILPLRHQAWKEVGLVIPQGTLPGAHCDRGGPPTWVGRLARTDGSPCICRGATTTTTHPLGWVALHCRGCTTHMFPPTRRGRPCYAGAMHITHAAPHLPRGVNPAIQGQCTLTTGDRRACKGRQ